MKIGDPVCSIVQESEWKVQLCVSYGGMCDRHAAYCMVGDTERLKYSNYK
jgi:hypothetical protein